MPKPLVTGISPKEGYPGTKVIIRGENLGKEEDDAALIARYAPNGRRRVVSQHSLAFAWARAILWL